MSELITSAPPVTLPEKGYSLASREGRNWYLLDRAGVIGLTATPQPKDEIISVYEPESMTVGV